MTGTVDSPSPALSTPRSALFVPADAPSRHARAFAAGADAVILDLEDSVAPGAKDRARAELAESEALSERIGSSPAYVRINSPLTPAGQADLEAAAGWGVDALMVPKSDPDAVGLAAAAGLPLIALIETATGIFRAPETLAHPSVAIAMLGPVDLAADLGVSESHDGDELLVARGILVLAAAAAEKPGPLDGPCVAVRDRAALAAEIARAKRLGFAGKTCIHPAQVEAVTTAFSPSQGEVDWAGSVIREFEAAGGGVAVLDGRMIDPPVVLRARQILANEERNNER
jgi:citrate lyase subunit beta / citryl-CoA lyase